MPHEEVLRLGVRSRPPRLGPHPGVADLHDAIVRVVVEEARMADELPVEVVREPGFDGVEPLLERFAAFVAAHAHQRPNARVLRDCPERLLVPRLERLEPDAPPLERYVKRQPSPSANERRMRRATTALCTSSGPS